VQANGQNRKQRKKHSAGESKDQRRKDHKKEVSSNDNINMRRNKEERKKKSDCLPKQKLNSFDEYQKLKNKNNGNKR